MGDHDHRHLAAGVTVPAVGEVVEPAFDHHRAGSSQPSSGSAMKPSSDIARCVITSPIGHLLE